jgi:cell division protein FtsN
MAEAFDPYHKWLGISPEEQPANHYRLLAIREFESDPEVIESAADRQMAHVRSFQTGPHSAHSQRLLNELSAARLCLLTPARKAAYDKQLQRLLAALSGADGGQRPSETAPPPPPRPPPVADRAEALSDIVSTSPAPARRTHPLVAKAQSWQGPLVTGLVMAVMVLGLWLVYRHMASQEAAAPDNPAAQAAREPAADHGAETRPASIPGDIRHLSPQASAHQEPASQAEKLKQQEARRREMALKAAQDRRRKAAKKTRTKDAEDAQPPNDRQDQELQALAVEKSEDMEEKPLPPGKEKPQPAKKKPRPVEEPPPAEPASPVIPPPPLRADDNAWKAKAEQFARDHLGRLIDDKPLSDGKASIPLDDLPAAPATSTWFLGNGRIYVEDGAYAFGEGFEHAQPETRYEIPALAAALHLKSVFVVMHQQGDVLQLAVGGVGNDLSAGSDADRKARITELEQRINMLKAKRRAGRTADDDAPDTDVDDDAHANKGLADELQESLKELATLKSESHGSITKDRRENDQRLAALRQRCRSISVLVYQPVSRRGS